MGPSNGGAGEKTEKATPKRRRDARKKGQIIKSQDLVIALSLLIMLGGLSLFGPYVVDSLKKLMVAFFSMSTPDSLAGGTLSGIFSDLILRFLLILLPILGIAFLAGLIVNYLQVGFLFAPDAIKPKFSRISMISGFKRMFSVQSLANMIKAIAKITVLCFIAYGEYTAQLEKSPNMMGNDLIQSAEAILDLLLSVGFKFALALVIMAPFDLFFQWRKHEKDLMMTKQEVKEEYKQTEGDPKIKGKIKQKQREMSAMRMMQAVAEADVVITNPTHYAVALAYKEEKHKAPIVLAKGKDHIARKIKERAAEHRVEMVENKTLAQQLYFFCEIGDEVPEELYQAVAEILAYIYKLKGGR
ncbi:MAG: flagellar biosynthesis protein FlhB [Christensenellales bacterium]